MNEDGLDFDSFKKIEKQFHVTGGIRHVISIPIDLQYKTTFFDNIYQ